MKSFKRLGIDPLAVYGTVVVKCPVHDTDQSAPECRARVLEELAIVQPRIVVVMGEEALEELNELGLPLADEVEPRRPGELQQLTPSLRRALRARHRRLARRGGRQARVLARLPVARRVVRGLPAVLEVQRPPAAVPCVHDRQGEGLGGRQPHGEVAGAARGAP